MTIVRVLGIVAVRRSEGDFASAKGECLDRLAPAERRSRLRAQGPSGQEKFLLFRVGEELYGLGIRGLREVLLPEGLTPLPSPPYQVCAALEHRGRRLPVIRMGVLFDVTQMGSAPTARVVLTEGGGRPLGLLVDEVQEMAEMDPKRLGTVPALATLLPPACFRGLVTRQDRIILLVNEDGLGSLDEVAQFYATGT